MPRAGSPYGPSYRRAVRTFRGRPCELRLLCSGAPSTSGDHVPPLSQHTRPHVDGSGCCTLRPACVRCQREQGRRIANRLPMHQLPVESGAW
jgi:hypothetical protein